MKNTLCTSSCQEKDWDKVVLFYEQLLFQMVEFISEASPKTSEQVQFVNNNKPNEHADISQ